MGLAVLLVGALLLAGSGQGERELERLAELEFSRAQPLWVDLVELGPAAADLALEGFPERSIRSRRLRAALVLEVGVARHVGAAADVLARDSDALVRERAALFLGSPALADADLALRRDALARMAGDEVERGGRVAALSGLASLPDQEALALVAAAARTGPVDERELAAGLLPESRESWPHVLAIVEAAFTGPVAERPDDRVAAAVLPLYGRLLADQPERGEVPAESAPILFALRSPAPRIREAGREAFQRFLGRLRELGEGERALRWLDTLASQGLDRRLAAYHRARIAFFPLGRPELAREAARSLRGAYSSGMDPESRAWLFRSQYLEAMAELALGRREVAAALLESAQQTIDGLLALRRDLGDDVGLLAHAEALYLRALVGMGRILCAMGEDLLARPAPWIELARVVHASVLEGELCRARAGSEGNASMDSLLDAELSPFRLIFTGVALPGLDVRAATDLQQGLGRLLATVAPAEFPGFEPLGAAQDAFSDPRRSELLVDVLFARLSSMDRRVQRIRDGIVDRPTASLGILPDPDRLYELQLLRYRREELRKALEDPDRDAARALRELRVPSYLALWLSRDLRTEGRTVEARALATRVREDLERDGLHHSFFWGLEMQAEIEMALGSSWIDEGEPQRAEQELSGAVTRLEDIERRLEEGGASPQQIDDVRALRASALVSLAVNANVKLGDPERALEYYERAYALRQDEFMRVLLACYRARSGRAAEARALLREVRPGPQTYYNLACTHALLGEREQALEYLARELQENHFSPGSLERQKAWAREDPDLRSLADDPAFRRLVGLE